MDAQLRQNVVGGLTKYGIVLVLLIMVMGISIAEPRFLSQTNIFNVLTQSSMFGILALGMTFVITSKGIDLSVGSVLAFTGVVCASLSQVGTATNLYFDNLYDLPVIVPIVVTIAIGFLLGSISGALIAFTGIPAFIATLGMMTIARGMTLMYTDGMPISQFTPAIRFFGDRIGGVIPVPVLVWAVMIVISWILLSHTSFGKYIYAIGGNVKAAEISGVNVKKNQIFIYGFSGLCAGVAAIVFAGRVGSVNPGAGLGFELTAIAATTIGGTSHYGGIGTIWGAVVGALVIGVLRNGMTILEFDAYWQPIVEGLIIITAVAIDMRKNAKKK